MKHNLSHEQRVKEFLNEPDILKFYRFSEIEFSDGVLMGNWFFQEGHKILDGKTFDSKSLRTQLCSFLCCYDEFIELFKYKGKIITAYELKKIYFDSDNKKSENIGNRALKSVYSDYTYKNIVSKENEFELNLIAFLKNKKSSKFIKESQALFENGVYMGKWFIENEDIILSYPGILGDLVRRQYQCFKENRYIDMDIIDLKTRKVKKYNVKKEI